MRHKNGQASLILIILSAIAIILFAITLNWGRVSQIKTVTEVAATTSTSLLASNYASYGQMLMKQQLGGTFRKCKHNSIFGALLSLILVIVIIVASGGVGAGALGTLIPGTSITVGMAALAMSAASLVLQVVVVQPGLTRYWNQLQKDAGFSTTETFLSNSLQVALQNAITDRGEVTDYFDSNTNGRYGFNTKTARPEDTISRYAFFHTEYLRNLKSTRSTIDLTLFRTGLKDFLPKVSNPVKASDPRANLPNPDPRYYPCCLPIYKQNGEALRPDASICPDRNATPLDCNGKVWSGAPDFYGNTYSLSFDPARPDYDNDPSGSFLSKFGIDEEVRPDVGYPSPFIAARSKEARSLFKAFWDMDGGLQDKPSINDMQFDPVDAVKRIPDVVTAIPAYKAKDDACVDRLAPEAGINWKPGKETYCKSTWPYDDCAKYACTAAATGGDCCTAAESSQGKWPEDLLDDTIDRLKIFHQWGKILSAMNVAIMSQTMDSWYNTSTDSMETSGRYWLGPKCAVDGSNKAVCSNEGYDDGTGTGTTDGGVLYTIDRRLRAWNAVLRPWLDQKFMSDTAWCLPPTNNGLSTTEVNTIENGNVWGTIPTVLSCLKWYANDDNKNGAHYHFKRCQDKIEGLKDATTYIGRFDTCKVAMDNAIKAETYVTCGNNVTLMLDKAKASTQYNGCLDKINSLKASGYCAGVSPTQPPAECLSFNLTAPSTVVIKPNFYDPCATNSYYMNWINKSITYFGQTFSQYCASPSKPASCKSLYSNVGEPTFDGNICAANPTYMSWLQTQITNHGGNTVSQICTNGPLAACANVPASSIVPMPDACTDPQAYSNWLEASKASYNTGQTFDNFCSTNPVLPPAPECSASATLPRSVLGTAPAFDACTIPNRLTSQGRYQQWLTKSMAAMEGPQGQQVRFKNRHTYLNSVYNNVLFGATAIADFQVQLTAFLAGPVDSLLKARQSINAVKVDSIPNSVIYGWQDLDPPIGKNRTDGYWHIVQVTGSAPSILPSVGTKTKGFLGMTRCYFLKNYENDVQVTVNRWDEDHDQAKFANKVPIWKVRFQNPSVPQSADINPASNCYDALSSWKLSPNTFVQLSSVWSAETSNLTQKLLKGAYMIQGTPAVDNKNVDCFNTSLRLLNSGVTTKVCAHYGNHGGNMGLHFTQCP